MQAQHVRNLHIDIDNPAGEVVPTRSSEINEDDWHPNLIDQDLGEKAVITCYWEVSVVIVCLGFDPRRCSFMRPRILQSQRRAANVEKASIRKGLKFHTFCERIRNRNQSIIQIQGESMACP